MNNASTVRAGATIWLVADVTDANMGYSFQWQRAPKNTKHWEKLSTQEHYSFAATESDSAYWYRAVLTAEDGTVITSSPFSFLVEPADNDAETGTDESVVKEETVEETAENPVNEPAAEPESKPEEEPAADHKSEPEAEPAAEPKAEPEPVEENLDVRVNADGMSSIVMSVPASADIVILGVEGDWAKVMIDGQTGYIYAGDLKQHAELPDQEQTEEMKVTIFSSRRSVMKEGELIHLSSRLEGFDGYEIKYQWECDKHDGSGFRDIEGADGSQYSFSVSAESLTWDWRLSVYYR